MASQFWPTRSKGSKTVPQYRSLASMPPYSEFPSTPRHKFMSSNFRVPFPAMTSPSMIASPSPQSSPPPTTPSNHAGSISSHQACPSPSPGQPTPTQQYHGGLSLQQCHQSQRRGTDGMSRENLSQFPGQPTQSTEAQRHPHMIPHQQIQSQFDCIQSMMRGRQINMGNPTSMALELRALLHQAAAQNGGMSAAQTMAQIRMNALQRDMRESQEAQREAVVHPENARDQSRVGGLHETVPTPNKTPATIASKTNNVPGPDRTGGSHMGRQKLHRKPATAAEKSKDTLEHAQAEKLQLSISTCQGKAPDFGIEKNKTEQYLVGGWKTGGQAIPKTPIAAVLHSSTVAPTAAISDSNNNLMAKDSKNENEVCDKGQAPKEKLSNEKLTTEKGIIALKEQARIPPTPLKKPRAMASAENGADGSTTNFEPSENREVTAKNGYGYTHQKPNSSNPSSLSTQAPKPHTVVQHINFNNTHDDNVRLRPRKERSSLASDDQAKFVPDLSPDEEAIVPTIESVWIPPLRGGARRDQRKRKTHMDAAEEDPDYKEEVRGDTGRNPSRRINGNRRHITEETRPAKIQRVDDVIAERYVVPEKLKGFLDALGKQDALEYIQMMEKHLKRELSPKNLDKYERRMFAVPDVNFRLRVRQWVMDMVEKTMVEEGKIDQL